MRRVSSLLAAMILAGAVAAQAGTPLSKAVLNGDLAAVKARVAAGEKVNEEDRWGWTPLLWAVYYNAPQIADFLLEQGADPNCRATRDYIRLKAGCTPLIIAGYCGQTAFVEPLLKHGARTDLADRYGFKALDYAKKFEFPEIVALLEPVQAVPPSQ